MLNNNRISKIAPIADSLPGLENLMLANNRIVELSEIDALSECKNLKRLVLNNNTITQMKGYRAYVIARIPSLKMLDFQKVKKSVQSPPPTC